MKTAIFLGAGASAAEGAPIQSELFKEYFGSGKVPQDAPIRKVLGNFFQRIFQIDLDGPLGPIAFPTFEEALGVLDLSETRRESLRGFNSESAFKNEAVPLNESYSNHVNLIRFYLTLAMAKAIDDGLRRKRDDQPTAEYHQKLVDNLRNMDLMKDTLFISTNYDLCIDEALKEELDYGVEFSGNKFGEEGPPNRVSLFKIHGSLNWLYCPVCNNLNGYEAKAVLSLLYPDRPITQCGFCETVMAPVIVPPTFYKDMSRVFLSSIWNKTENSLREVDHVIFCGYSLPDADMHIKYLLKRMQTNRKPDKQPVRFTVINHHEGKSEQGAEAEHARYDRYFGRDNVRYTMAAFEDFVQSPEQFYNEWK
ncbi:MAG TPA: SIR2 family protein [Pyrinomonadaceae bacterium]|nr:SIR2 family protein [Pyrinomonadaceae bacterium]